MSNYNHISTFQKTKFYLQGSHDHANEIYNYCKQLKDSPTRKDNALELILQRVLADREQIASLLRSHLQGGEKR